MTSTCPRTAPAAPGTRRAAASTSPGRSRVLLGMQPQYEHSPPTRSFSTRATDHPRSAQRPAATPPAGPPPLTTTSNSAPVDGDIGPPAQSFPPSSHGLLGRYA